MFENLIESKQKGSRTIGQSILSVLVHGGLIFGAVKAICDPDNLLNPGNIVDPVPFDADLRPTRPRHAILTTRFRSRVTRRATGAWEFTSPTCRILFALLPSSIVRRGTAARASICPTA